MKAPLITLFAVSTVLFVSCKEKSAEVKQVEEQTARAVESGAMTKDQANAVNNAAANADDLKDEAKKIVDEQLASLEKATTAEEMKAAIKDATKANMELAVKSGMMTKEQVDLSLNSLSSIDMIPEETLKSMVEQLKTTLRQAQSQTK